MSKFNKKKLPSRHTSLGADRAPHRSFYYAMGETEQDVAKPFVGVVSTWNEAAPCNTALMRQAQSVKKGVRETGGTPREFCTITVTDGIARGHEGMKSSLISFFSKMFFILPTCLNKDECFFTKIFNFEFFSGKKTSLNNLGVTFNSAFVDLILVINSIR